MQKKYVILTNTIFSIGGSQLYTRNKVVYLQEKGWDVYVFSSSKGIIMIDELKKYELNVLPELNYCPHLFTKATRDRVINTIKDVIGSFYNEDFIIETHTIKISLWGEILAQTYNSKHFIYLLCETFGNQPKYILDFMNYKHIRKELAGISEKSLDILFKEYKKIEKNQKFNLKAVCTNSVDDVENSLISNIEKYDINIGSIGRLNKPFVIKMIDEVVQFCNNNPKKEIQLILVGGSTDGIAEKEIQKKTENVSNLNLIITGRIFPIPRKLFKIVDIFISVAGAAYVSANEGVLTLTLDVINFKPIGLLGYETQDTLYSNNEQDESISEKLQDILITREMHKKCLLKEKTMIAFNFRNEFNEHMNFINESSSYKEYYNTVFGIIGMEDKICRILILLFGIKCFQKLINTKVIIQIRNLNRGRIDGKNS